MKKPRKASRRAATPAMSICWTGGFFVMPSVSLFWKKCPLKFFPPCKSGINVQNAMHGTNQPYRASNPTLAEP